MEETAGGEIEQDEILLGKSLTTITERSVHTDDGEMDLNGMPQPKKFMEEESREKGSVKLAIWQEYLSASGGWWFWPSILLFFCFYQVLVLGRSWWISIWTRSYSSESVLFQQSQDHRDHFLFSNTGDADAVLASGYMDGGLAYYLGIYAAISILICTCGTWRYWVVYAASLKASRILFDKFLHAVLRAPLRWLDTVPVGRISNRFVNDFQIVDSKMSYDVGFTIYQVIQLLGIVVASLFVSFYMLLSAMVLLFLCAVEATYYLRGAREAKRLESSAKSPILEQFESALAGIGTIRAFDKTGSYIDRYVSLVLQRSTVADLCLPECLRKLMHTLVPIGLSGFLTGG